MYRCRLETDEGVDKLIPLGDADVCCLGDGSRILFEPLHRVWVGDQRSVMGTSRAAHDELAPFEGGAGRRGDTEADGEDDDEGRGLHLVDDDAGLGSGLAKEREIAERESKS